MRVPSAIVASRSARSWGWVTSSTCSGALRQQNACTVECDVEVEVVAGLDYEGTKD